MKIVKTIGAGIGVVLCFLFLGCGSVPMVAAGVPDIQQVLPLPLVAGSSGATLKVTGSNFDSGSKVLWNGTELSTTVVDSNTLSTPVQSASLALPGDVQLAVKNSISGRVSPAVHISISSDAATVGTVSITSTTLPSGMVGSPYAATLTASGGSGHYTWSIGQGKLPGGITLNSTTGVLSGTPSAAGNYSFNLAATDTSSRTQSKSVSVTLTVKATAMSIDAITFAPAVPGVSYSQQLNVIGGSPNYRWSIAAGALPGGLSLSPVKGVISGTPTSSGVYTFTVSVKDSESPAQIASAQFTIAVSGTSLKIATTTLATAQGGSSYSQSLQATGGTPGYQWRLVSGALPPGLALNQTNGLISGTPTTGGTSTFVAGVTDSSNPSLSASSTLSLTVAAPALAITAPSLPALTVGASYSQSLQATGGTTPYSWSLASGQLPPGLSLSPAGAITGSVSSASSSYTYTFSVKVTDSSSSAQTATAPASIALVVSASPLAISSSTLASGTSGAAYSSALQATGGTPGYSWRISVGSLPAGLTLSQSTGTISGTPSTSGTANFTATVSDNSNPIQTQSVNTSITVAAAAQAAAPQGPGTYWYIRPDGGTRYSTNQPTGQCDGKADVAYPGTGTNQHCAFSDYRYLYDDQSYGGINNGWVIAGGDTVIVRGGPYRIGFDSNTGPGAGWTWCFGGNGTFSCTNPTIPAGTASQHTRILGENYATCNAGNAVDKTKLTQIFGGYGVWTTLNLVGAQYVDVQCLEITSHAQCITHGSPAVPKTCSSSSPVDDYDSDGIVTDVSTHDLLLQDLWIHGHTDRGVRGAIGGLVTCLRCDIFANGMAGWDFDDGTGSNGGNGTASTPGSVWNFKYSSISWSGCNEIWPRSGVVDTCYSQSTGGYGDGVGTPPGTCLTSNVDHSAFNYNTQDGLDLGHINTGICTATITNSVAIGNNGGTFKIGANLNPFIFENNLAMANCLRLSKPMAGASSYFNANLADFCRANDTMSFNFNQGGTAILANNTVIGYAPTTYDVSCWTTSCSASTLIFENNITYGYDNPTTYNMGGQPGGVGALYFQAPIGTVTRSNNIWYGMRSTSFNCSSGYPHESCVDPQLVNEPAGQGGSFVETELDNFNFNLSSGSPAIGAGLFLQTVPLDYTGAQRANPPSIGAFEQ